MAFFLNRESDVKAQGKQVYSGPLVSTSADHPLNLPTVAHEADRLRLTAAQLPYALPSGHAGRASGQSTSVRSVLTGAEDMAAPHAPPRDPRDPSRHEYAHPTFHISRSQNGATAKELLYGGESGGFFAPPQPRAPPSAQPPSSAGLPPGAVPPEAAGHPLLPAYVQLAHELPSLPRDAEGCLEEHAVRESLMRLGLELSLDGFAELLARCDVSPFGFPPFDDFLLCCSRPARAAPAEPTPLPAKMPVGQPDAELAASASRMMAPPSETTSERPPSPPAPAPPPPAPVVQAPAAFAAGDPVSLMQQAKASVRLPEYSAAPATWRRMQLEEDLKRQSADGTARLGVPLPAPTSHFPLGIKSNVPTIGTNVKSIYSKSMAGRHVSSQKFSSSFNPDHFLYF
jgi:hypothetical protein